MWAVRLALVGLMVAGADSASARRVRVIELTEADAGRPVAVAVGEKVQVRLNAAGGSGYRWRVGDGCAGLLSLEGETQGAAETRPGAPQTHVWVFAGRGDGACELRFELARSWETTVTGKVVVFQVKVGRGA